MMPNYSYLIPVFIFVASLISCSTPDVTEGKLAPPSPVSVVKVSKPVLLDSVIIDLDMFVDKPGRRIQIGDFVIYRIVSKADDGTIIQDSYFDTTIEGSVVDESNIGDLVNCLVMMSEGDSAFFKTKHKTRYITDSIGEVYVDPLQKQVKGDHINHNIKIEKVVSNPKLSYEQQADIFEKFKSDYAERTKIGESKKIEQFFKSRNLKPNTTISGAKFSISKDGSGDKPSMGDAVIVDMTLSLITGRVVSTTDKHIAEVSNPVNPLSTSTPVRIRLQDLKESTGINEALMNLSEGAEALVVVPSSLAFGKKSVVGGIGYESLVFDLKIRKIERVNQMSH